MTLGETYDKLWMRVGLPHEVNERESFFENLNVEGKIIADLGAGTLRFSLDALKRGAREVVGLDLYRDLLKWGTIKAKRLRLSEKVSVIVADCRYLPFHSDAFDIVAAIELFEHIPQGQIRFLNEVYRVLKPLGTATISTWNIIPMKIGRLLGLTQEKLEYWKGHFYYRYHYPWEFKQILLHSSFKRIKILGAHNTYLYFSLEKMKSRHPSLQKTLMIVIRLEIIIDKLFRKLVPLNWATGLFLTAILNKFQK